MLGRHYAARRPQRHRRAHPALGPRAQPADAAARPGVDPPAPGDPRRDDRRADRGRRHDAQRHHAAAATAGRRHRASLRLRLGSGRGRPQARLRLVDPSDPRIADQRGARGDSRASWPRNCSPSTRCTPAKPEEEIVFLSDAFLSHVPESGAHVPDYRSWLDEQDFAPAYAYLHRMLQFLQWQKRQRGSTSPRRVGAEVAGAPRLSGYAARPVPRPAHRAHAPRPARHDSVGREPQRDPACDACRHRRHARVGARVAAADGMDQ